MNFKLWLIEAEVSDYDKVANYARHLAREKIVSLDDYATLLNVLKNNLKKFEPSVRVNAFSDYQPLLQAVLSKMSLDDKKEGEKLLDRMFDDDTFKHSMAVHGHTSPQINVDEMERIIHTIMEKDYNPIIVEKFLQKYGEVYHYVSDELKREFFTWVQDKIRRMGKTKTLAHVLADLFKKMEEEEI